jgi:STE24 endopeptidase
MFVSSGVDGFSSFEVERARRYHRPLYAALGVDLALGLATLAALTTVDLPLPWWAEVVASPALVSLVTWVVGLPVAWWRLRHERRWGLTEQSARGWLGDRIRGLLVGAAVTTLAVGSLLAVAHVAPTWWPLPAALGAAAFVLLTGFVAPVLLEPVFNRFAALEGELAERLRGLAERAGVPIRSVLVADASRRTSTQNAYVSGIGATRRVVVWDTLLDADPAELELVVAHELGHRRMRHVSQATALGMAGAVAFVLVLRLVVPHPQPGDAALVLLLGLVLEPVALPFVSAVSRRFERAADRFSLDVVRDPAVFAAAHRRLALANLADLDPPRWLYLLLFTHPTPSERIASAR